MNTAPSNGDRAGRAVIYLPLEHDLNIRIRFSADDSWAAWQLGKFILRSVQLAGSRSAAARKPKSIPSREQIVDETNFLAPALESDLLEIFGGTAPVFYQPAMVTLLLPLPKHIVGKSKEVRNEFAEEVMVFVANFFVMTGVASAPADKPPQPLMKVSAELPLA